MPVIMSTPSSTRRMSSLVCSKAERLRLRPWLEKMIQEQKIPGLKWEDENAKIIKIPWKHAARHGWTRDKDASLFKEWAIHTKKYDPVTDEPKANPKIWKANFRCAINSLPDIEELKGQGKTKGHDAFKVYRLNPQKPKKTDIETARKSKSLQKNTKSGTVNPRKRKIPDAAALSQLSIRCQSVQVNIGQVSTRSAEPPSYDSAVRERMESQQRLNLRRPTYFQTPLPAGSHDLPPYTTDTQHVNSHSPISTTCSSTLSSPTSTPASQVSSSPVFTYPPSTSFPMDTFSTMINIKQEHPSSYNDDDVSDSSDMTDEDIVDMVDQMREDSPHGSPMAASPPPTLNSYENVGCTSNEWLTSTLDNKQYFSNVLPTKVENVAASSYPSPMIYPRTSTSTPSTLFPLNVQPPPAAHFKDETKDECSPCMMGATQNYSDRRMNDFGI